jgi:putative ABC transport system permease protein
VVGILKPTGTPVDRTVHVSLEAITAIHHSEAPHAPDAAPPDLTPDSITAFLVSMKDPVMTLQMQRAVNEYRAEALLAIVPGVALMQLWEVVGIADRALMIVAAFVVLAGLLGMLTAILTSLHERRREMAILRSVGAGPRHVFGLLVAEAGVLATLGVLAGVALAFGLLAVAQPLIENRFGIFLRFSGLAATDLAILAGIIGAALLMGLVPAWRAYRHALSDGLIPRV